MVLVVSAHHSIRESIKVVVAGDTEALHRVTLGNQLRVSQVSCDDVPLSLGNRFGE